MGVPSLPSPWMLGDNANELQRWSSSLWHRSPLLVPDIPTTIRYLPFPPRSPLPGESPNRKLHAVPLPPLAELQTPPPDSHRPINKLLSNTHHAARHFVFLPSSRNSYIYLSSRLPRGAYSRSSPVHSRFASRVGAPRSSYGRITQFPTRMEERPRAR